MSEDARVLFARCPLLIRTLFPAFERRADGELFSVCRRSRSLRTSERQAQGSAIRLQSSALASELTDNAHSANPTIELRSAFMVSLLCLKTRKTQERTISASEVGSTRGSWRLGSDSLFRCFTRL